MDTKKNAIINFFSNVKAVFRFLFIGRISISIVLLLAVLLFSVDQVTDAIVSLGNNAHPVPFLILSVFLALLSLMVWYWAKLFYAMEYHEESNKLTDILTIYVPKVLGTLVLFIFGLAFMVQASVLYGLDDKSSGLPLFIFGIIYFIISILIFIFFIIKLLFFKAEPPFILTRPEENTTFLPFESLPQNVRIIVISAMGLSVILLTILVIFPIPMSRIIGDAITVLVICMCIYLPLLYAVAYFGSRIRFPLFLVLAVVIAIFTFFNANKNIRILDNTTAKRDYDLMSYFYKWYETRAGEYADAKRAIPAEGIPMIMILSEGGGIRASYYSGCLLSRITDEYPVLSKYVFGIQGVSGGSFGASVYAGLLRFYMDHPEEKANHIDQMNDRQNDINTNIDPDSTKYPMQRKAAQILGQDYLSPVITGLLTREVVHLLWPWPIESFDYAKTFELAWEREWTRLVTITEPVTKKATGDMTFSRPFTAIWDTAKNNDFSIPPLFINITNVETGRPFTISPVALPIAAVAAPSAPHLGITNDFYYITGNEDIRVSTSALLSARFPYVGPAGTIVKNKLKLGFVDGGYFDNTGANFANDIYLYIEDQTIKDKRSDVNFQPIVIYLKNGSTDNIEIGTPERSILYQLQVPFRTLFNVQGASTVNGLDKLNILLNFDNFQIITLAMNTKTHNEPLVDNSQTGLIKDPIQAKNNKPLPVPLGWALSGSAQEEIDMGINAIMKELPASDTFKQLLVDIVQK